MASANFQVNFADYLRIVFQRKWWLMSLVGVSLLVAGLFACMLPLRFRADMEINVLLKHRNNPYLKLDVTESQMVKILADVRDRSKSEGRMALMTQNLRLAVKNAWCRDEYPITDATFARDFVAKAISDMKADEQMLFVRRLELVTLARVLGLLAIPDGPWEILNHDGTQNTETYSEYLVNGENDLVIKRIAEGLDVPPGSGLEEILAKRLIARIGNTGFVRTELSDKAVFEFYKELRALDRLRHLGLHMVCATGPLEPLGRKARVRVVEQLRNGLTIANFSSRGSRIVLRFDSAHKDVTEAIPHIILDVVYNMLVAEYYAIEEGNFQEARKELRRQRDALKERQLEVSQQIFRHKDILDIQKALQDAGPMPDAQWSLAKRISPDAFSVPQVSIHIRRMNAYDDRIAELRFELGRMEAELGSVRTKMTDPALQRVRRTISGEVDQRTINEMTLQKNRLESELRLLLFRSTPEHPTSRKLIAQIDELGSAIKNQSTPVVIDSFMENPKLSEWENEAATLETKIASLRAEMLAVRQQIEEETKKAIDAPQRIQEYNELQMMHETLRKKIEETQKRLDEMEAQQLGEGGNGTLTAFEIATSPIAPHQPYAPNRIVITMMGLLIGLLAAILVVFFIEYTDHSLKDGEEVKYYFSIPVLGTIPEYSFQQSEELFANEGRPRRSSPPDMGVHGSIERMLRLGVGIVVLGAFVFLAWKGKDRISDYFSKAGKTLSGYFEKDEPADDTQPNGGLPADDTAAPPASPVPSAGNPGDSGATAAGTSGSTRPATADPEGGINP